MNPSNKAVSGRYPNLAINIWQCSRKRLDNFFSPLASTKFVVGKGYGSFAISPIPRLTVIATFGGVSCTRDELSNFDADRVSRSIEAETNLFFVGPQFREPGDSINHSCDPNCGMRNATQVITIREISVGEELTFDYAMSDASDYDEFDCSCGTALCRGMVSGDDWRRADLQVRYAGLFSPYISRKIASRAKATALSKRDVERMLDEFDRSPQDALLTAMRIVIGRPNAAWNTAVLEYCDDAKKRQQLLNFEQSGLDDLVRELNETRMIK